MDVNMKGLLENLKNKKLNYELDLVLEGGAMNGAFEKWKPRKRYTMEKV